MSYILTDETKDLLESVKDFCEKEVKEQCKEYDISGEWPKAIYDKAAKMQLNILSIPEEYGGIGLDKISCAAMYEEMAKADAGFAVTLLVNDVALDTVFLGGTEEQKQKCCKIIVDGGYGAFCVTEPMAGSDVSSTKTTAVKDGGEYVLNGRKCFITNGSVADFFVVTAVTDKSAGVKGMTAFLVFKGAEGLSTGNHENKMGIRTSTTCDVVFEDVRIPASNIIGKEGDGFKLAMKTLDVSRAFIACGAVGIAQRAIDEAVKYAKERVTFGKPIGKNQAIQFMIADMEIKTETARQMTSHALRLQELGLSYSKESAIAKCYASDIAFQVASDAVQIFGGYGYSREYPVEKLLRDAKIFQIFEGTNQIQRMVISSSVMGKF
ncbi:MAG: acyl-CoA dehydrogenase family protein [Lachnospiraceae bacterium]|nr:acyl-CoA dehydrogenase family protein [Lachnospiraceae bacterium]